MSCKITFESIITFREYDLLLILHTSTINVEFYSLSNIFYFIILCYIEQKIYLFLWRPAISSFKCTKKSGQQGSTRHLKVCTLQVNENRSSVSMVEIRSQAQTIACTQACVCACARVCMHTHTHTYDGELPLLKGQSRLMKSIKYTTQQTPVCTI